MKDKNKTTKLQKEINYKFAELAKLQKEMVIPKKMIAASLIKRYLGTKKYKRTSHAFYLSIFKNGKTKLEHVSKGKIGLIRNQVEEWKEYQRKLTVWQKLTESLKRDLKQFGKLQAQLGEK